MPDTDNPSLAADTDAQVLKEAGDAVIDLDINYRLAPFAERAALAAERDRAFNSYALARLNLMKEGMVTTPEDVAEMRELRKDMEEAADKAALLAVAGKIATFLARLALL